MTEIFRDEGHSRNHSCEKLTKGSLPNKKCHKSWKKSMRGGVKAKIKIVYISNKDYFD